jgi:hypothetical protein
MVVLPNEQNLHHFPVISDPTEAINYGDCALSGLDEEIR